MLRIHAKSHLDHKLTQDCIDYILELFKNENSFFIKTFNLPENLPQLENALYGPLCGDAPVKESEVYYEQRGDRPGQSRMVDRPIRPTRVCTVIAGPIEGEEGIVLYTAYGGPAAEKEPFDLEGVPYEVLKKSLKFWEEHALGK